MALGLKIATPTLCAAMTQHLKYVNWALVVAIALIVAYPLTEAFGQERRPCVNKGSPVGCVPFTRSPQPRSAVSPDVDDPGLVPVSQWPISRAQREQDKTASNVPAWEPMKNPAQATVTVTTPDNSAVEEVEVQPE